MIGLTIVAMGTSAPEAAVSITAGLKGNAGITVGNIVGSNILNILIILGITGVITKVAVQKSTLRYEIPYMIFITLVLAAMGYTGKSINFVEGIILWILFILYLIYMFLMAKRNRITEEKTEKGNLFKLILPVQYEPVFIIDAFIAAGAGVILFLSAVRQKELGRFWGTVMLLCYGTYFVYLLK